MFVIIEGPQCAVFINNASSLQHPWILMAEWLGHWLLTEVLFCWLGSNPGHSCIFYFIFIFLLFTYHYVFIYFLNGLVYLKHCLPWNKMQILKYKYKLWTYECQSDSIFKASIMLLYLNCNCFLLLPVPMCLIAINWEGVF